MARRSLLPALAVGVAAFALYRATLLPGFDFGDTASFQTMAGSSLITPRDGYPVYFAIGGLFLDEGANRVGAPFDGRLLGFGSLRRHRILP